MAVASAALTAGAFADDLELRMVPNGHGQYTMIYAQPAEQRTSVALFTGNRGLGRRHAAQSDVRAVTRDNAHGQQTTLFQQDR